MDSVPGFSNKSLWYLLYMGLTVNISTREIRKAGQETWMASDYALDEDRTLPFRLLNTAEL